MATVTFQSRKETENVGQSQPRSRDDAGINPGLTHPGQQSVPPVIAAKAQNERRRFAKGRICQAWQSA
jgi:hypothetical protein